MKRPALLLLAGIFSGTLALAQDNIILKNGTEIQGKVLEVSPSEIKYRRQDNLEGPVYTTGTRDIILIKYANGTKDVLNPATTWGGQAGNGQNRTPSAPTNRQLDGLRYNSRYFNRHFSDLQGRSIPASEMSLLMVDQPGAMRSFERGQHLRKWAYITGGTALVLMGTGAGVALAGGFGRDRNDHNQNLFGRFNNNGLPFDPNDPNDRNDKGRNGRLDRGAIAGAAVGGAGVLLGIAALVLDHRASRSFRRAANQYHAAPATSLHLTPGYQNQGLGLALRF